jgi:energy-coupling factor transporter ATP-binding protein EcfA2
MTDVVSWDDFLDAFRWRQGEHVTAVGHTGSGKSTLINEIIERRTYCVFLATKKRDERYDELKAKGFVENREFRPHLFEKFPKQLIKPRFPKDAAELRYEHHKAFKDTLASVYDAEGWTVIPDELRHLSQFLKLQDYLELLWQQGRSLKITVVGGTQRPAHIPLSAYNAATHLFLWRDNDEQNLKRIAGIGSEFNPKDIRAEVSQLPKHEFLYLNTRTGQKIRSMVDI